MYADRNERRRFEPGSLGVALGINAAVVAALLYAGPTIMPVPKRPPMDPISVPIDPLPPEPAPPPPEIVKRTIDPPPLPRPDAPEPLVPTPVERPGPVIAPGPPVAPPTGGVAGGTGTLPVVTPQPAAPPLVVGPSVDPRYAADFQPDYPPAERRLAQEGRVVVRVLVGIDGRVKDVQRVSATSDAFFRATADRALRRWRFRPGTSDGVPVQAWRTMSLTFVMED